MDWLFRPLCCLLLLPGASPESKCDYAGLGIVEQPRQPQAESIAPPATDSKMRTMAYHRKRRRFVATLLTLSAILSPIEAFALPTAVTVASSAEQNKAEKFSDIDSKTKAAFTREYNKRSHKSQALVEEQGVSKKKKSSGGNGSSEMKDPDAIDEDGAGGDEDEEDDELNEEEVAKAFKKMKGKKGGKAKAAGKKKK